MVGKLGKEFENCFRTSVDLSVLWGRMVSVNVRMKTSSLTGTLRDEGGQACSPLSCCPVPSIVKVSTFVLFFSPPQATQRSVSLFARAWPDCSQVGHTATAM